MKYPDSMKVMAANSDGRRCEELPRKEIGEQAAEQQPRENEQAVGPCRDVQRQERGQRKERLRLRRGGQRHAERVVGIPERQAELAPVLLGDQLEPGLDRPGRRTRVGRARNAHSGRSRNGIVGTAVHDAGGIPGRQHQVPLAEHNRRKRDNQDEGEDRRGGKPVSPLRPHRCCQHRGCFMRSRVRSPRLPTSSASVSARDGSQADAR